MTNLLTKVKEALDAYEEDHTQRYRLSVLAPDMARALIAAGELAEPMSVDQAQRLAFALAAFRAAMEGRTDD
jgi:GH18 family chitinase